MEDIWTLVPHLRNLSLNLSSSSRLCPNSSSRQSCPISSSRSKASVRLVAEARRLRSSSFSCCKSLGWGSGNHQKLLTLEQQTGLRKEQTGKRVPSV